MTQKGNVFSLQISPGHGKPMIHLEAVTAVERVGLEGDIHAARDSSRQILLIDKETLDVLNLSPAAVRENITTQGIPLMSLKRKQRFQVGRSILEVTNECEPCEQMEQVRVGLQDQLRGRRGMLAKVVQGGEIRAGDTVTILL